ncbi:MAG: ribonuclease E/G [Anaerostipes hadrus]|nr:ribonuclease E/G [uncultured Anaerostipes sp.]MCI6010114.1 ribonuclease E/G [Anaerostipes hadrus]MEE0532459.1 ribonuclease E/G [Anaerostipes hadrus]
MAYTEIVITKFGDHLVSMLLKDGQPVEFQCVSEKNKVDIGNIYIGVVKNVVKNINGAFVEFDQDETGFLSMRHRQYKAGDEVLVQIKKEATEEKRPMLSDQIELTGKYLVLTSDKLSVGISNKIHQKEKKQELKEMAEPFVTQEYGFILRTEAAKANKEDVLMEADQLSAKYHEIVAKKQYRKAPHLVDTNYDALEVLVHDIKPGSIDRIVTDQEEVGEQLKERGYEVSLCSYMAGDIERRYRFRHYLSEVFKRKIFMKSGGFLYIEQTEAMAVIDVNTGKSIGKKNQEAHIKKINLEAAKEAARQIRLRNLSGIIMIDFIDMKSKDDEKELLQVMQHYLNGDSKKAVAVDITKLGIMEITRKKEKNPIFRQISIDILK